MNGWTLLAAACLAGLNGGGCGRSEKGTGATPAPPPAVRTAAAGVRKVEITLPFTGRVEAVHRVELRALVEGIVRAVGAEDGAPVKEGTVLFTLGGSRVETSRSALRDAVKAARDALQAAEARLAQANRRAEAHLALPGEVAAAEKGAADEKERFARARAALERYEAALEVRAPVAGRFVNRRVSPGQAVEAGEVLGELLEPGSLRVAAEVIPRPGISPAPGQAAEILGRDGASFAVKVIALHPEAGSAGSVRVWLGGPGLSALRPGTVVRGRIVAAVHDHAVWVPEGAVVRDAEGRALVFVGRAPHFERRVVTLGVSGRDGVEIRSGIQAGEAVVVEGAYELYWAGFREAFKVED